MPVRMPRRKTATIETHVAQVCARGWQDYMLETRLFATEERVTSYLDSLDASELAKLGIHARKPAAALKH